ncbi:EGF-like domain-containing protein [Caenorhabditis elegans]|uniref:EGF-like domain-containing protein n=1 Tax=Caenorhabditis elegans TaxID=6239 RepID=A0A078BS31_CAEEL|nr:EGF-like domain-containing protein [Caenorhabditis elegans]CDX47436.1 EGF-like domain-containing protein [Caenorhabditis elegans]|eukprot:NP_001294095.1 Uncharacterized protein CELE_Y51H4A.25 [Caenorhabditis elegans]
MLQKTALIIGALSLIAGAFSDDCPSFFTKDDNGTCTIRQCLNGGYLDVSKQICICPSGYLGIHCEAGMYQIVN